MMQNVSAINRIKEKENLAKASLFPIFNNYNCFLNH